MKQAFVIFGSNLDPSHNLGAALKALRARSELVVLRTSPIYRSKSLGGDYPDFLNAAVLVETSLDPGQLRRVFREIEAALGRERSSDPNAPRTIDLDLALYDELVLEVGGVRLPDPEIFKHAHVVVPLAALAPAHRVPGDGRSLAEVADAIGTREIAAVAVTDLPEATRREWGTGAAGGGKEQLVRSLLSEIGEDPDREGLAKTPLRVSQALEFLTSGYHISIDEVLNQALFESPGDEMVVVREIEFYSLCEHHLLPFYGRAHIGYLPRQHVVGVSKIARLVDVFARRLQVQERLVCDVADALMEALQPHGVGVVMDAVHLCMLMRGVQKQNSSMVTNAMRGTFRSDPRTRGEFLSVIGLGKS